MPNPNVQLHGGLTAPASAIVGISDAQALTNKTFDISLNTFKTATNTAGHIPRSNGTQYVDAQLGFSDLSGTASTSQIGTETPAAGKYVDGGTGAWTTLPSSATEFLWEYGTSHGNAVTIATNSLTVCTVTNSACSVVLYPSAHTIKRLTFILQLSAAGCWTSPQLGIRDETSSTVLTSLTLTNGEATGFIDSGALSVSMTAGDKFSLGAGCATTPTFSSLSAVLQ